PSPSIPTLGAIVALKDPDVDDVRVAHGLPLDRIPWLVAQTLVELGGLEAVRDEDYLQATAAPRFRFRGPQERFPQTLTPMTLVDPDVGNLAATSPCVAAEPSDDITRIAPNAPCQELSVEIPRCLRIEFVYAIQKVRLQL